MMNNEIINWWEWRRIRYNIFLIAAGIISLTAMWFCAPQSINGFLLPLGFGYLLIMNVFYFTYLVVEFLFAKRYHIDISASRLLILDLIILAGVLITFGIGSYLILYFKSR